MNKNLALVSTLSFILLGADNFAQAPIGNPAKEPGTHDQPNEAALEFLSDLPELKGVSLGMSEKEFQNFITRKELRNERAKADGENSYLVRVPWKGMDASVYFGFRDGKCTGIQRLQPIPKKITPTAAK